MKHAYCILAHGSPGILKVLIGLLDDPRNDIYLHLDAKVDVGAFRDLRPVRAGFAFVKERVNAMLDREFRYVHAVEEFVRKSS